MLNQRRDQLKAFLAGFRLSWNEFIKQPAKLNALFSRESRLDVSDEVLDDAASIEPNRWVTSHTEQRFEFVPEDLGIFDQASGFLLERGIIKAPIDARDYIDMSLMKELNQDLNHTELSNQIRTNE